MASAAKAERGGDSIDLPSVSATINYSQKIGRARSDLRDPSKTYMPLEPHTVDIHDARPIRDQLDLDQQGFLLLDHKSRVSHLRDPAELNEIYHDEVGKLVHEASGADFVIPYRNYLQVRLSQRAPGENGNDLTRPAGFAHMDLTHETAQHWARRVQEIAGVEPQTYSRVAFYQTWRAVSEPPQDFPLALTDGRSVTPGNYVVMDNITTQEDDDHVTQTRLALYEPRNRWYYFSHMRADELLIFKGNDSLFGDNQSVCHTGFDNTPFEPDAIPRESIEARFFGFWK